MFAIFWPLVFVVSGALYLLLLLFLPFSPAWAMVMLYAIISFWSRLPGVGMWSPFYILYLTDFVDVFSLIIAINLGGVPAAIFTFAINMVSRACGVFPYWMGVFEDSLAQAIVCLIIPFVHVWTGGDILVSMVWYTVLRLIINIPLYLILPDPTPLPQFIIETFAVGAGLIAINAFYISLFGGFFDSLLQEGMRFNWLLFLIVTAVIFFIGIYPKRRRRTKASPPGAAHDKGWDRKIRGWVNLKLYLLKNHQVFGKRKHKHH